MKTNKSKEPTTIKTLVDRTKVVADTMKNAAIATKDLGVSARELDGAIQELAGSLPVNPIFSMENNPLDRRSLHNASCISDVRFRHSMDEEGLKILMDAVSNNPNAIIPTESQQAGERISGIPQDLQFPDEYYNTDNIHIDDIITIGFDNRFLVANLAFNNSEATEITVRRIIGINPEERTITYNGEGSRISLSEFYQYLQNISNDDSEMARRALPVSDRDFWVGADWNNNENESEEAIAEKFDILVLNVLGGIQGRVPIGTDTYKTILRLEVEGKNSKEIVEIILSEQNKKPKSTKRRIRL